MVIEGQADPSRAEKIGGISTVQRMQTGTGSLGSFFLDIHSIYGMGRSMNQENIRQGIHQNARDNAAGPGGRWRIPAPTWRPTPLAARDTPPCPNAPAERCLAARERGGRLYAPGHECGITPSIAPQPRRSRNPIWLDLPGFAPSHSIPSATPATRALSPNETHISQE